MAVWPCLRAQASGVAPLVLRGDVQSRERQQEADDLEVPLVRGDVHGGLLPRVGPIRIDPIHTQQHAHDVQMVAHPLAGNVQRSRSILLRHGRGRFLQYLTACARRPDGHSGRQCTEESLHPPWHGWARFLQYLTACARRPDGHSGRQCTEESIHPSWHGWARFLQYLTACARRPDGHSGRQCTEEFHSRLGSIPSVLNSMRTTSRCPFWQAMYRGVRSILLGTVGLDSFST